MANHTSATAREGIPHANKETKNKTLNLNGASKKTISRSTKNKTLNLNGTARATKSRTPNLNGTSRKGISRLTKSKRLNLNGTSKNTISNALRRRAQAVIRDRSIDAQSRALIRYGLETNDPWLPELVRRADVGETILYTVNTLKHPHPARMVQTKKRLKH